jgi:outer membrane protein OmpA-like peptidoglycan-associated protein
MKLRLVLAAATCLVLPLAAHAQPVTGPYVSLGAGANFEGAFKLKNFQFATAPVDNGLWAHVHSNTGYVLQGSVGYGFGNGFRAEVEGDFTSSTFSKIYDSLYGTDATDGTEEKGGVFLNGLYDFNVGLPIFPYVGAGIGYELTSLGHLDNDENSFFKTNQTRGSAAYQGIAGVSYPVAIVPGLSATLEYRFTSLFGERKYTGGRFQSEFTSAYGAGAGAEANNSVLLGLRYQLFNAPVAAPMVAAPAAAPAPAEARTYLVFFDWDKYNLTPRATQIIAEAASDSKTQTTTTLDVSGYTDTSGTPVYNQGLSLRRAKAVAAKLVADGVPGSEIEIHAYGETHLLVPTGPGVREPQNRRVEIVLN